MRKTIMGAAMALVLAGPAAAATIQHDIELETTIAGAPSTQKLYEYELPKFDVSLGTLKRVELFWTADAFLRLTWTTNTNSLVDVYGAWIPSQTFGVDLQPQVFGTGLSIFTFESMGVGRSPSGTSGDLAGSAHVTGYAINDTSSEDLSPYWTSDKIRLAYAETFYGLSEAGGGMDLAVTAIAKHKFSYVYTYLPGIPEPSTWAMMLIGVGAGGAALRGAPRRLACA